MKELRLAELRQRFGPQVWWYSVGVLALSLVFLALAVEVSIAFLVEDGAHQGTLRAKRARVQAVSNEVAPYRGLPEDIAATRDSIAHFYSDRFPATYSQVVTNVGEIAMHAGVSLSNVVYSQGTPGSDLSEVSMEVAVAGSYPQLAHFVNGIERDRNFFIIRNLSFTGQQGGDVTLHLRVSTWLLTRPPADSVSAPPPGTLPAAKVTPAATGGR